MNPEHRRQRALERYKRLSAPFVDRMVQLRVIFTRATIKDGVPEFPWTNAAAENLYKAHADILALLRAACASEDPVMPLLPALPPAPTSPRCDKCAPELGCWADGACRKR